VCVSTRTPIKKFLKQEHLVLGNGQGAENVSNEESKIVEAHNKMKSDDNDNDDEYQQSQSNSDTEDDFQDTTTKHQSRQGATTRLLLFLLPD